MSRHNRQKEEDKLVQEGIKLLREALNEANRAEFDAMDADMQRVIYYEAVKDGIITFDPPYAKATGRSVP